MSRLRGEGHVSELSAVVAESVYELWYVTFWACASRQGAWHTNELGAGLVEAAGALSDGLVRAEDGNAGGVTL